MVAIVLEYGALQADALDARLAEDITFLVVLGAHANAAWHGLCGLAHFIHERQLTEWCFGVFPIRWPAK